MSEGEPGIASTPLPPLYDRWMRAFLGAPVASETESTCDRCAMCKEHGDADAGVVFFQPDLKCCTYLPKLPNFLVGAVLADDEPGTEAGKAGVHARIAAGLAVTPLGLGASAVHRLLYDAGADNAFGRANVLRCPHFVTETGLCGIWRHRNHVCTTWFCKHLRGAVGHRFWMGLRDLLGLVETTLARWCVLELGFGPEEIGKIAELEGGDTAGPPEAKDLDRVPDPARHRRLWGKWSGREAEFYREAARLVAPLSWQDVVAIGGPDLRMAAAVAASAHGKATSSSLPEKLVPGAFQTKPMPGGATRVVTYSPHDPLVLPGEVFRILSHFDGRPTREVLESLVRDEGLAVEEDLLLQLVDFEVLVPPEGA